MADFTDIGAPLIGRVVAIPPVKTRVKAVNNTTPIQIKVGAGAVIHGYLFNNSAAKTFFKFYDVAVAPTVGTTVPAYTIGIPAATGVTIPGAIFTAGIFFSITTGIADTDNTAPAIDDVHGFIASA